jgi:hypothetical protein
MLAVPARQHPQRDREILGCGLAAQVAGGRLTPGRLLPMHDPRPGPVASHGVYFRTTRYFHANNDVHVT